MGLVLVRAKRTIKAVGTPFRVPPDHLLPDRLVAVLALGGLTVIEGMGASPISSTLFSTVPDRAGRIFRSLPAGGNRRRHGI